MYIFDSRRLIADMVPVDCDGDLVQWFLSPDIDDIGP